jgi:type I restriction enzyme M protein
VLAEHERVETMGLPEEAKEKLLLRASKVSFYNASKMDLALLGASGLKDNLACLKSAPMGPDRVV